MNHFNLNEYENEDLKELVHCNKKFNGFTKVELNTIDKIIGKEHRYGYNRTSPFGIWIVCGVFIPFWLIIIILLNIKINNYETCEFLSFIICIIIGIVLQIIYDKSCDKIDYNYLINKTQQINMFEILEK